MAAVITMAATIGIEIKVLVEDKESGLLTTLLRMAPGACLPDHQHIRIEQAGTAFDPDRRADA